VQKLKGDNENEQQIYFFLWKNLKSLLQIFPKNNFFYYIPCTRRYKMKKLLVFLLSMQTIFGVHGVVEKFYLKNGKKVKGTVVSTTKTQIVVQLYSDESVLKFVRRANIVRKKIVTKASFEIKYRKFKKHSNIAWMDRLEYIRFYDGNREIERYGIVIKVDTVNLLFYDGETLYYIDYSDILGRYLKRKKK
jgi:hypothetical protein